jgi:hypothetical protein
VGTLSWIGAGSASAASTGLGVVVVVSDKPTNAGAPLMVYPRLRVKLALLSVDAHSLVNKIWLYCQDVGNGGRFHVDELPIACDRSLPPARLKKALAELERPRIEHRDDTSSPLWLSVVDDHVQMPEWWIELNPGAEVWQDDTLRWRRQRNKELHAPKMQDLREKIRRRDRNLCRYCGRRVDWAVRNAPHAATYDHVDPDEGNTLSNVVVACRQCNGRKRHRTPEQWIEHDHATGLSLLPAGTTADQAEHVRMARDGPPQGSTLVRPEFDHKRRSRARPPRVEPGSNPTVPPSGSASSRTGAEQPRAIEVVPPPDDHDYPWKGAVS